MTVTRSAVVAAVIEVCGTDESNLVDDATLESLEIDSLDLLEVGMIVEENLGVIVEVEEFDGVGTLGETVAVFERLARANSADG